jgi:hypothetical protein
LSVPVDVDLQRLTFAIGLALRTAEKCWRIKLARRRALLACANVEATNRVPTSSLKIYVGKGG